MKYSPRERRGRGRQRKRFWASRGPPSGVRNLSLVLSPPHPTPYITAMTVPVSRVTRALSLFALAAECSAFVLQSLRFKVPTPAVGMPRCAHGEAHCWSTSRRRPAPRRIRALEGFLSMAASSKKNRGDTDVSQLSVKKCTHAV